VPAVASIVAAIVLTAPWPNGGTIPKQYTCDGKDLRPAIGFWSAYPQKKPPRRWVAIEMIDVDAPGGGFVHWLQVGRVLGRNTFGKLGYSGPCPPPGDAPHRYVFRAFVLDGRPALKQGFTDVQLRHAIRGHVTGRGTVVGRYGR
jgi:phosphatidylethanolamine-binding protein (PEBP) family uncharacterized protein